MKLTAWMFAGLLLMTGVTSARAEDRGDKKSDSAASPAPPCKPLPGQRRLVNFKFKPNSALVDVAGAYAALSCKRLKLEGDLSRHTVTLDEMKRVTLEEVRDLVKAEAEKAGLRFSEDASFITLKPAR